MSNSDFKDYTGNIRLDNISFDGLHQMFENDKEEYDPADDKRNKFYVGKIGKYQLFFSQQASIAPSSVVI